MPGFGFGGTIKPDPDASQNVLSLDLRPNLNDAIQIKDEIKVEHAREEVKVEFGIAGDSLITDVKTENGDQIHLSSFATPGCSTDFEQAQLIHQPGGTVLLASLPHNGQIAPSTSTAADKRSGNNKQTFHVDNERLRAIPESQQQDELQGLGLRVYNQDELEEGV